ncbi:hypothetical protein TNCV_2504221, partial [Trichonephila clavipes]
KPIRPTFCRHCNRSIFLSSTLENHYLLKHHRRLSPQSEAQPAPTNKTATVSPCDADTEVNKERTKGQTAQHTAQTTPATTAKAGKLPVSRLAKRFRCEFCEKRFATRPALEDHARCVHEADCEMTFAFEEDEPTEKEKMPARKGKQGATTEHLSRPQQTIHDSQVPTTSRAVWCQHCVRNIDTGLSLADHILAVHNHTVTVDDDGLERTEVVCFDADTVVDAANCSNTPAFNVICTEDARATSI